MAATCRSFGRRRPSPFPSTSRRRRRWMRSFATVDRELGPPRRSDQLCRHRRPEGPAGRIHGGTYQAHVLCQRPRLVPLRPGGRPADVDRPRRCRGAPSSTCRQRRHVWGARANTSTTRPPKGPIDTMTIGLAREVADEGIRVNAVRPGLVDTTFTPAVASPIDWSAWPRSSRWAGWRSRRRWPRPSSGCVRDEASYVTGALIDVSGGR